MRKYSVRVHSVNRGGSCKVSANCLSGVCVVKVQEKYKLVYRNRHLGNEHEGVNYLKEQTTQNSKHKQYTEHQPNKQTKRNTYY